MSAAFAAPAVLLLALLALLAPMASPLSAAAAGPTPPEPLPGGFPSAGLTVERSEILAGGPRRDGIASVDAPQFVSPEEAVRWVKGEHAVVGIIVDGDARAYPVHLLEHHQVVNDRFGDQALLITYDPLIDVARAWLPSASNAPAVGADKRDPGSGGRFGVSGLIHRSNFLLYDRHDDSLWTQFDGQALTGSRAGSRLEAVPVHVEPLRAWQSRHPDTRVLRPPEPRRVDYRNSPYSGYWVSPGVPFPTQHEDPRIHPKEIVLGARVGERTRVYVATVVERRGGRIADEFEGHRIRVEWDAESGTFIWDAPGEVELVSAYWFAWKNFHPDTEMWNVHFEPSDEVGRVD